MTEGIGKKTMSSEDSSHISQEFLITNNQISTACPNSENNKTEDISLLDKDEGVSASTLDCVQPQQQDCASPVSCLSTASQNVDMSPFSSDKQLLHIVAGDAISDEKQTLTPNDEIKNSHIIDSTRLCCTDQPEAMDISNCNYSASLDFPGISNICDEGPVSLPKDDHDSSPVIEQGQHFAHISEAGMVVGEDHSSVLTSGTEMKSNGDSALIKPALSTFEGEKTQDIHGDTSLTDSSYAHIENVSLAFDMRYNLSVESVPRLVATATSDFRGVPENFLRGCKWSPDGSCVLTNSNDNCLRTFQLPNSSDIATELNSHKHIESRVRMQECGQIYDYAWHPQMSLAQADYGRIACTCSGIPIHMWDASTGQIVANYRAYDQFDEITPAFSLAFSLDGSKLYAGYNKTIRIFDTEYPGRSCKTVKTYDSQKKEGQTGIVSCFTFSPDWNGLYVAGSYSRHIGMYDATCDKLVCLMQGQHGGVTHLMFSPDATKLYSGGRKDAEILCWDMRNMDKILFSALRDVKTNQRIYFDLSQSGRYLVSGNNDGTVAFWDTLSPIEEINGDSFLKPCSQFQAHSDCVNGVSLSQHHSLLATASGQRHFHNFDDDSDSTDDERMEQRVESWDFSLRLWQIPVFV